MRFILIRHGETEENSQGVMMGHMNAPLNEEGIRQAQLLAKRLQSERIDVFYSSDLDRCIHTLNEIRKFHQDTPLVTSPAIRERHFGDFSGRKRSEVDWDTLPGGFMERKAPAGESLSEVETRVRGFIEMLQQEYVGKTVAIVSHNGPLKMMRSILTDLPAEFVFSEYSMRNTAFSEILLSKDGATVNIWDSVDHLDDVA